MSVQIPATVPQTISIETLAARFNVSSWTVRTWLRQGRLPYFKVGRRVLIPVDGLESLMSEMYRPATYKGTSSSNGG